MSNNRKSRKPNISSQALERARRELYHDDTTGVESSAETTTAEGVVEKVAVPRSRKRMVTIEDLKKEYGHVIADLRSMGILAALLFIGMIVFSMVIGSL
jgi:hypothetical protein